VRASRASGSAPIAHRAVSRLASDLQYKSVERGTPKDSVVIMVAKLPSRMLTVLLLVVLPAIGASFWAFCLYMALSGGAPPETPLKAVVPALIIALMGAATFGMMVVGREVVTVSDGAVWSRSGLIRPERVMLAASEADCRVTTDASGREVLTAKNGDQRRTLTLSDYVVGEPNWIEARRARSEA
jgi:hypothetical protein